MEQNGNKINSKNIIGRGMFFLAVGGIILSIILLIPNFRAIIIRFSEIFIVHRTLTYPVWHRILKILGLILFILSSLSIIIIFTLFKDIYRKTINMINRNLIGAIGKLWFNIPLVYKKSFCVVFLGLNIVFMLHTANFMFGNHEWPYLLGKVQIFSVTYLGRYFGYAFPTVFFGGHYLPVLENLLAFAFFSVSAVMLCFYWRLPKSTLVYSVTGLLFVLQPYTISWMYYASSTLALLQYGFFILAGFILSNKAFESNSKRKRFFFILFSSLCFWYVMGMYMVVVSTIAVIFIGKLIVEFTSQEYQNKSIIQIMMGHIWTIVSIVIAVCLHFISIIYLKKVGIFQNVSYMNATLALRDIPNRILQVAKTAFSYLVDYKVAFFPKSFTVLFTILLIISVFVSSIDIFRPKISLKARFINVLLLFCLFYAALVFSFTSNFISASNLLFSPRIDFLGIAYFHILIVVILFRQNVNFVKNISLFICIVLIHICAVQDFYAMKVWKLSFDAEKMEYNRIIARIETTPDYQDDKDYQVIILGATRAYYSNFYDGEYDRHEDLLRGFMPNWSQMPTFYVYTSHSRNGVWRQISDWQPFSAEFIEIITAMPDEVENAEAWPSLKSIFIKDDIMFIALDQGVLDKAKQLAKEYNFYTRLNEDDFTLLETIPISEDTALISVNDIEPWEEINDNLVFHCGTYDPYIVIPLADSLSVPAEETYIVIECTNSNAGSIQAFYDYGSGFSEENSTGRIPVKVIAGESSNIILPIVGQSNENKLKAVRIDPPNGTAFTLHGLRIVTFDLNEE
jgi:hypothetical protein